METYAIGVLVGMLSGFCAGYAVGASRSVELIEVPHGQPPPRGYHPISASQTLYGPAPSSARLGVAHDPEGPIIYAFRLHETCEWSAATRAVELSDGTLKATVVYVRGHWEETVIVDSGKWCRVDSVVRETLR